ncbi:MAG: hypothetical protein HY815_04145 [Candidatus Riflebacteria bacterium]|nr:hypothetical protein [Candidatus Riflebacteria bacterium]
MKEAKPSGRIWLGYCLTIAAPAIGWVLEDRDAMSKFWARIMCLAVLILGVAMTAIGVHGYRHRE